MAEVSLGVRCRMGVGRTPDRQAAVVLAGLDDYTGEDLDFWVYVGTGVRRGPNETDEAYRARGRARLVERQRLRGLSMAQLEAQAAQRP